MPVILNSNTASQNASRRLEETSRSLQRSFQRLSSGLRVNRASDDASGLAISQLLNVDSRVFSQGIRNLNDGISALNIGEGALTELSNIVIRIRELATQSANGTLLFNQRKSLHQEANALVREYNRIADSTSFNGRKLLDGSLSNLTIQGGYGATGGIDLSVGSELADERGTGSFTAGQALLPPNVGSGDISHGDFNGDGILDFVLEDANDTSLTVLFGNGDGTFARPHSFVPDRPILADGEYSREQDINNDGFDDLVGADSSDPTLFVFYLSRGDGTFAASQTISAGGTSLNQGGTADINNDGNADLVGYTDDIQTIFTRLGNGDGTFQGVESRATAVSNAAADFVDVNNDGRVDAVVVGSTRYWTGLAAGDGTFSAVGSVSAGFSIGRSTTGDFNGDGLVDLVLESTSQNNLRLFIGNGNGTFRAPVSIGAPGGSLSLLQTGDFNGDGLADLSGINGTGTSIFFGNGDGTFQARRTALSNMEGYSFGSLDADGSADYIAYDGTETTYYVYENTTADSPFLPFVNLYTQEAALETMDLIDHALSRVVGELANIGATQSRVGAATSVLRVRDESLQTAFSRIVDADVAEESALLLRNRILQSAAAAVLSQANQLPALALDLLDRA